MLWIYSVIVLTWIKFISSSLVGADNGMRNSIQNNEHKQGYLNDKKLNQRTLLLARNIVLIHDWYCYNINCKIPSVYKEDVCRLESHMGSLDQDEIYSPGSIFISRFWVIITWLQPVLYKELFRHENKFQWNLLWKWIDLTT